MDVASPNSDYREASHSRRNDVVVESELTDFVSLGHCEDDTRNMIWFARRHGVAELYAG
jgi:hypothetical protein